MLTIQRVLEKTEGTIQRNCLHWVHKTQDEDKQSRKNTSQKIKKGPFKKQGANPGAREGGADPTSYKTPVVYIW